ncbi:MAG: hypothetical protein ACT4RN_17610 [Pseudonocardia sp.]
MLADEDDVAPHPGLRVATVGRGTGQRAVPLGDVAPNPLNKRSPGEDDEIAAMAESIRALGVIQPPVVCSSSAYLAAFPDQRAGLAVNGVNAAWVALIGNRRLRAARFVGLAEVEVVVNDEQVS